MAAMIRKKTPGALDGAKWRDSHQKAVNSLLGGPGSQDYRRVRSQGSMFLNRDNWRLRAFVAALTEWAALNGANAPTEAVLGQLVYRANTNGVANPEIHVMSTPPELDLKLALAITGGDYHEAGHTLYSRRKHLHLREVKDIIPLWEKMPYDPAKGQYGWAKLTRALLDWSNIIEDIFVERSLQRDYPGTRESLPHLQDLILKMEQGGQSPSEHRKALQDNSLRVVSAAFRDLGLGYDTPTQQAALAGYKSNKAAWAFVTEGPLRPLLDRAIALVDNNPGALGSLFLAMEVLIEIAKVAEPPESQEPQEPKEGGEPQEPQEPQESPEPQDPPPPQEPKEGGDPNLKAKVWKVGDRGTPKSGPHAGRLVEVVRASLPDPQTGAQEIDVRPVTE